ncbi:MAG TPA: subtilisin [Bacteroidetes bacterium]|nr:subtilisin [Bacteroidota bacterium]
MATLYPISFIISLAALSGWFFFRDREDKGNLFRKIFFGSFILYGASWFLNDGAMSYKMMALGREMLILATVPLFLSFFRKSNLVYMALLFAVLGALKYFYFENLKNTFPQKKETISETYITPPANIDLDKNGELLVEILDGHQLNEIQKLLDKYGLSAKRAFYPKDKNATDLDDYFLLNIPAKNENNLGEIITALQKNNLIEWVEMNEQYALSPLESVPQRRLPKLNKKYGLNDPGLENLWGFEEMHISDLYDILQKNKPQKKALIAILDTGIDAGHEDIKANFKSLKSDYDSDAAGHGTHCAGIAAAVSNNNVGVASFSQNNDYVQVTSIKVLTGGGFGTQKMIIDGILEAADAGADVLSLSLGGPSNDSRQRAYKKAVAYANKKGAIVVVAAGNSNRNAKEFAPANTPGVITVSAVDTLLNRASFSNIVADMKMGVAAPGVNIYSTFPGGQYRSLNGTSMATPYVAGLLGLMKSLQPKLTTKQAFDILNKTGRDTGNTRETGKLIQPGGAVRELVK